MNTALIASAALMGVAGSIHCVAMCGPTSAAAVRLCATPGASGWGWLGFHAGRLAGYMAAGAVVAASVGALAGLATWSPALRPLWLLAHLAALALGLFLLVRGEQPAWLARLGRNPVAAVQPVRWLPQGKAGSALRASAVGGLWFAWPCGLLQSALLVAALSNGALGGAAVMAAFGLGSALALGIGPALWLRWRGAQSVSAVQGRVLKLLVRLSGAMLAGAALWALGHDVWKPLIDYCFS